MTEVTSLRILAARQYVRESGQGNIGLIGALEVAVEDAEREIEQLRQEARASARELARLRSEVEHAREPMA